MTGGSTTATSPVCPWHSTPSSRPTTAGPESASTPPGVAVLRDQHPLREHLLAPALTDGMHVGDWLRLLNGFVFFFTSSDRLQALRSAYRTTPAVLLTVRTRSLVQEHGARVRLAGMNTGNTSRRVKERGASTFLPIRRYDLCARVQEVAVMDEVSDLRDHLPSAELLPAED
jgi:hypothetical protein